MHVGTDRRKFGVSLEQRNRRYEKETEKRDVGGYG